MDLILADDRGTDIRILSDADLDIDLNDTRDFELKIPRNLWDSDFAYGARIYIPDTEYGGIIGKYETDTALDTITVSGFTWRGMLYHKAIIPPAGEDYRQVSGDVNALLKELIEPEFDGIFRVSDQTAVAVKNFQFNRYVTLLDGIEAMLQSVNYRLELSYDPGEPGRTGFVFVRAVPVVDYSNEIELSQDSQLSFRMTDVKNGINHLIGLGKGELQDRTVLDLYVQQDGSIGETPFYTGAQEIIEIYENTSAESEEFEESCRKKLLELMNYQSFEMDVETLDMDVGIGDLVGGRDYLTGMYLKKPVANKIITIQNGMMKKEYTLEGN